MRYEGNVFRPPSEARSYILQVTVGCAHNRCTFCDMYKDKKFHLRSMEDVFEDLAMARRYYSRVEKIFLADGDALCLSVEKLLRVLSEIHRLFPECRRVGIYGSAKDVRRKTPEELAILRDNGIGIIYIGAESGSDEVLAAIQKGSTRAQLIEAVRKIEDAGIAASVTFISGLAGRAKWREHAVMTGTMISEMEPSYVGLLTLMTGDGAPLTKDIREGRFEMLTPEEVMLETELLIKNINVRKNCVFRSNHASNYLSLKGDLPQDKERLLAQIAHAKEHSEILKEEYFRML